MKSYMVCLFCQVPTGQGHKQDCPQLLNNIQCEELKTDDEQELDTQPRAEDLVGIDIEELDFDDLIEETRLMPLQVYIAASMKDREVARLLAVSLLAIHVQSTASWITDHPGVEDPLSNPDNCRYYANNDLDNIDKAQAMIFLAGNGTDNTPKKEFKTPGKTTELGYAIAQGKPILFIGKPYSVFHHHESVTFFDNTDDLISWFNQSIGHTTNAIRLAALL